MTTTRRQFLRQATHGLGFLAAATTLPSWLGPTAHAATAPATGSRALVCVFLLGGNDSNNILVPRGTEAYRQYGLARPTLGLEPKDLEFITPTNPGIGPFSMPTTLGRLRAHFEQGRAAFVSNVGPLVKPLIPADYSDTDPFLPENLFSHSDQQDAWASALANPGTSTVDLPLKVTGWGGRAADKLHVLNADVDYPEVTSFGGKPRFCAGLERKPMVVGSDGILAFRTITNPNPSALDQHHRQALLSVMAEQDGNPLEAGYADVFVTARTFAEARAQAREAAWAKLPMTTQSTLKDYFSPPTNEPDTDTSRWTLHTQLLQVVKDLVAGAMPTPNGGLGMRRQVFSVGFGSFDTHQNQREDHAQLLKQLDFALDAFQKAATLLESETSFGSNAPQVTLFTMSDFNRTLVENGGGGTDHAWGGHALVLGSRVAGRKLYGLYPDLTNWRSQSTDTRGRWIPTLSVEQYGWTLASWLGLSTEAERDHVFPNLGDYVLAAQSSQFPDQARAYSVGFMMPD